MRRPAIFAASVYLLVRANRVIEREGVAAARAKLLRAWRGEGATEDARALDPVLGEIDAAIASACEWLPVRMACLPRSMAAYALANALGARPVHHMGVRARPYYGHAWTCVGERAIGDELGELGRAGLRVVKRYPARAAEGAS